MTNPYLIAHIVRGLPCFDIAHRLICPVCEGTLAKVIGDARGSTCECRDGYWWMIHGARAHPYWHYGPITVENTIEGPYLSIDLCVPMPPPPPGHPDFIPTPRPPGRGLLSDLAARLGFAPSYQKVNRR